MKISLAPFALAFLAACPHRSLSQVPATAAGTATKNIPVSADIDILFVIDNSLSTADKQALFAQNFPSFVDVLDTQFGMGRPNLHIAVVSTTVGTQSSADLGSACPAVAAGDDGAFHSAMVGSDAACAQCALSGSDHFLSDVATANGRDTNYTCPGANPLAVALPCIAELGTGGCGFEAPLEAMKRALDGSQSGNKDFLRAGAYLAVVILTDEDDCSIDYAKGGAAIFGLNPADVGGTSDFRCQPMYAYKCDRAITADPSEHDYSGCVPLAGSASPYLQDTSYYYNALTTIKDPSQLVVAVIGGTDAAGNMPDPTGFAISTGPVQVPGLPAAQDPALEPSCTGMVNGHPAIARPGLRLADFVSQFGERGKYYSVCQSDYTPALRDIGEQLYQAISPCLEGPIDVTDTDPRNPGTQPQCAVSYLYNFGTPQQQEQQLEPCIMTDPTTPSSQPSPCWYVVTDANVCADPAAFPTHLELKLANGPTPPAGTVTSVSCAVAPN